MISIRFVHVPKTGGTSISEALGIGHNHALTKGIIQRIGLEEWKKLYSFAFVRNPWDRAHSMYSFRKQHPHVKHTEGISFVDWVKENYEFSCPYASRSGRHPFPIYVSQIDWLVDEHEEIAVDFIGRFETLKEDFERLCDILEVKATLPHRKNMHRRDYHEYHTPETEKIIRRYYRRDIKAFGYEF